MSAELVPARLDALVRARIESASGMSERELARALRPFAPGTYGDARWAEEVAAALARARAGEGAGALPAAPWKQIAERIVPGLALGIEPGDARAHKRLADRDAWAAAIVGRALGLWRDGPPPSASAVSDGLVWARLDLAGKAKRIPPEVRAHFVALELGVERAPAERLLRQLAADRAGAARADLRALREALARRWLCGQAWSGRAEDEQPDFAAAVREAAARATDGVVGHKVFIAAVWRQLRARPGYARLSLDDFKRDLVAAHRAGQVALARADLVAAMDPAELAASQIDHLEAQYHFVERPS
jgi:hypothetical protein